MSQRRLPILTYHSIDDSGSVVSVAPALFEAQMEALATKGYQTLTLSDVANRLHAGQEIPPKSLVLTFDDGYRNVYTEAFPVLQRYGFTATIFLIADYCGKYNDWPGHLSPGRLPLMDWPEIKEMHAYGVDFGGHTLTHPDLTRLTPQEVEYEVGQSLTRLQDRLGNNVDTFAYPYGHNDASVQAIARRYYRAACTTRLARAQPSDDLYRLPRLDMYYFRVPHLPRILSSLWLDPYLCARQGLRELRAIWH